MMPGAAPTSVSYGRTRQRLETYFDRTAVEQWKTLTSDAPVSRVRAVVRAGRDRMRDTLLGWLPADMRGLRLLDAGCGTGALAVAAAQRGAHVVAIDVSGQLIAVARDRAPPMLAIDWHVGDMLDPSLGRFDHVVAMDSLIHYPAADIAAAVAALADRTGASVAFTFAPQSPLLAVAFAAGKLFPRGDRSPAIEPVGERSLRARLAAALPAQPVARDCRVKSGFYTSHALELVGKGRLA
jgi:magnesium-protoporphyrin O-methyltransferase